MFYFGVVDLLICAIILPCQLILYGGGYTSTNAASCQIDMFFGGFILMFMGTVLLSVTIDRYRKVCNPFGWYEKSNSY